MNHMTIYHKPTCSTCRKVIEFVKASKKPFTAINYYENPLTKTQLKGLLKKAQLKPQDVLRKKEDHYKNLGLATKNLTEDEWIDLLIKYPDLLQRPLVETQETALLARPPESIKPFLKNR